MELTYFIIFLVNLLGKAGNLINKFKFISEMFEKVDLSSSAVAARHSSASAKYWCTVVKLVQKLTQVFSAA
eukprot:1126195-Ditylum_brightwellii.AAC.1